MKDFEEIEYFVLEELDDQRRLERRVWHTAFDRQIHREGGPAVQEFDPETGNVVEEIWIDIYNHGKHRESNLPAERSIDPVSGVVTHELYYQNGRQHRDDGGPAGISRNEATGKETCHTYLQEGFRHRAGNLPALVDFDPNSGGIVREEYYRNDVLHRDDGPAVVEYDHAGNIKPGSERYYREGQSIGLSNAPSP